MVAPRTAPEPMRQPGIQQRGYTQRPVVSGQIPVATAPRSVACRYAGNTPMDTIPQAAHLHSQARQVGEVVAGSYTVAGQLGQGSSGITYAAVDAAGKTVAVKELSLHRLRDWKQFDLFEREAQVLAKLSHPCIPAYVDYHVADNTYFLVQEVAQGRTLQDMVASGVRYTHDEVIALGRDLLSVLQYLQTQSPPVIHRDIKPMNLVISGGLPGGRPLLIDFGGVVATLADTTLGSTVVGTYGYMAPEQFRGAAMPASDAYSVGAVLLFLLTGRPPHDFPVRRLRLDVGAALTHCPQRLRWLMTGLLEPHEEERLTVDQALMLLTGSDADAQRVQHARLAAYRGTSQPDQSFETVDLFNHDVLPSESRKPPSADLASARTLDIPNTAHTNFSRDALRDHPGVIWPNASHRWAASIGERLDHTATPPGQAPVGAIDPSLALEGVPRRGSDTARADSDDEGPDLPNPFEYGWPRSKRTIHIRDLNTWLGRGKAPSQPTRRREQVCRPWREAPQEQPAGSLVNVSLDGTSLSLTIPALGADDESCSKATMAALARFGIVLAAINCVLIGGPFASVLVAPFAFMERSSRPYVSIASYCEQVVAVNDAHWTFQQRAPKLRSGMPIFDGSDDINAAGEVVGLQGARVIRIDTHQTSWRPATAIELLYNTGSLMFGESLSTLEQEWLVGRVNRHLESILYEGCIDVENE